MKFKIDRIISIATLVASLVALSFGVEETGAGGPPAGSYDHCGGCSGV